MKVGMGVDWGWKKAWWLAWTRIEEGRKREGWYGR